MKTIGLIGGMSWESSAQYYRLINEETKRRLGGHHNARSMMVTVDFAEVEQLQHAGDWDRLRELMAEATRQVERGGADVVVLCTNTMHKLADSISAAVAIPFLHIADATAAEITRSGKKRVGLLGTRFTMEEPFYKDRMRDRFGIDVLVPPAAARHVVHDVIYGELCHGAIRDESRARYREIIAELGVRGAEAVVLGCTEIGLLISAEDSELPVFDTTVIHARAAVDFVLGKG
jgi:aspartate racemase